MTTSVTNNAVILNAGNSLASGAVARLTSWRQAKTPRGADRIIAWRALVPDLVTGAVAEMGMFTASGTTAPTAGAFFRYASDGSLRGVIISVSGAESTTSAITTPTVNAAHDYVILVGTNVVIFQVDNVVVGTISLGDTSPSPVTSETGPFCARLYNSAATATAARLHLYRWGRTTVELTATLALNWLRSMATLAHKASSADRLALWLTMRTLRLLLLRL